MSRYIEDAAEQAIQIAWNVERPITVQSLTNERVESGNRAKATLIQVFYWLAAATIVLVPVAMGSLKWTLILLVIMAALGWLIRWTVRRWQAETVYVDPEILVTVSSDGVAIASPLGDFHIPLDEVDATLTFTRMEEGVVFRGMDIKTPIGLLAIDNDGFDCGREAAAAIVQEMGWAREGRARTGPPRMI